MIPEVHCGRPEDHPEHEWRTRDKDEHSVMVFCDGNPAHIEPTPPPKKKTTRKKNN